jgi:signal transduction histidine kinase
MDEPRRRSPASPEGPARAERLLGDMQRSINHDLPNQMVAILGLLQVLELEEQGRLSPEGRDYLRRLAAITRRVQETLTLLRAIGRAAADAGPAENVTLADLARDAAAEVRQQPPARAITCPLQLQAPTVRVCRRSLQRAVVGLIRAALQESDASDYHLALGSRATPAGVELVVGPWAGQAAPAPVSAERADPLLLALVRELACAWGGSLTVTEEPGRGRLFTLLIPAAARPTTEP